MLLTLPPDPPPVVGRASVIDGDTLEIHGQRIRLWGIDAPESRQTCERGGETYRCGTEAARALDSWINRRTVKCRARGRADRYGRVVAMCAVAGHDMGRWLVRQGWALDFRRYSSEEYAGDQEIAVSARRGMHAGTFVEPWLWRSRS